jgi:hypothetical protein
MQFFQFSCVSSCFKNPISWFLAQNLQLTAPMSYFQMMLEDLIGKVGLLLWFAPLELGALEIDNKLY